MLFGNELSETVDHNAVKSLALMTTSVPQLPSSPAKYHAQEIIITHCATQQYRLGHVFGGILALLDVQRLLGTHQTLRGIMFSNREVN